MSTKADLRLKFRVNQKNDETSALIAKNVQHIIDHLPSIKMIGLYSAMNHEPDLATDLISNFKQLYAFPQIINDKMVFVFSFEYVGSQEIHHQIITPDLLVIPGIAFDIKGYRLGLGKGHYDRYLSKNNNIKTIGICFSKNLLQRLPTEDHDCKMDYIVTEHSIIKT